MTSFYISMGGLAVYPLWKGSVADAVFRVQSIRPQLRFGLAIVAGLPDQRIDVDQMTTMEQNGLLYIEVPQSMIDCTDSDLLCYVVKEVDGADEDRVAYRYQMDQVVQDVMWHKAQSISREQEEKNLLQAINDWESDEGSC